LAGDFLSNSGFFDLEVAGKTEAKIFKLLVVK
jgi:hypothetical protein